MILAPVETDLPDGTRMLIREVTPDDADLLRLGFDHLSDQSRHFRFFGAIRALSDSQVAAFTSESDRDHVAIGAAALVDAGMDPAGVARYVRLPDDPREAEFAITIVDRYQRRGLGSLMLGILAKVARRNDLDRLVGFVMRDNRPMLRMMAALGARREIGPDDGVYRMVIDLDEAGSYPDTPVGAAFRRADAITEVRGVPG